jgi:hypothetical protein
MKFDLHEIEIDDFEENSSSSDFMDLNEFSLVDTPPEQISDRTPKRYRFRTK